MAITDEKLKEKHETANICKDLCAVAHDLVKNRNVKIPHGYSLLEPIPIITDRKTNFKAVIFVKNDKFVVSFLGTEKNVKDWGANLKMFFTNSSKQIDRALKFFEKLMKNNNLTPENCIVTGHSEGGTEATNVAMTYGIPAFTFNAFGVGSKKDPNNKYKDLVSNYNNPYDIVSKLRANIGTTYIVPPVSNSFLNKTPVFGGIKSHPLKFINNCTNAMEVKEYKKKNPEFADNISDVVLTREDLAAMDPKDFELLDIAGEIDKRIKNNEIISSSEANYKAYLGDYIYVQPYIRDDGTEVSGYYRKNNRSNLTYIQ